MARVPAMSGASPGQPGPVPAPGHWGGRSVNHPRRAPATALVDTWEGGSSPAPGSLFKAQMEGPSALQSGQGHDSGGGGGDDTISPANRVLPKKPQRLQNIHNSSNNEVEPPRVQFTK